MNSAETRQFERDGYVFVPGLLDAEEVALLAAIAHRDAALEASAYGRKDASGRESRLSLWNHPGDNIYGAIARSERIVRRMEAFFGGEVYHYHSKMMLKEPRVGGAWEWHQDYGYWYGNGCLYPDMASCLIAVDRAGPENGCLQVLKGSHRMGRVEHGRFGDQTGADPERVAQARSRCELVFCEMQPGTALFFHANLLHCSGPNTSDHPRWSLICCYNAAWNSPYKDGPHASYTPLVLLPDSAIKETGERTLRELSALAP